MDTSSGDPASGLNILIVGGGIGGLTAAIALRQQGHRIEVFERSRFANEIGAAIHLSPNANGILKRLGVDAEQFGAVETEQIREFSSNGELLACVPVIKAAPRWQHKWLLVHRAHLHEHLKIAALGPGKGTPVKLHTSSGVADVDIQNAVISFEDGSTVQGDVVVGADGVNSVIRKKLPGGNIEATNSGYNAFRFLISRQEALDDPRTAAIVAKNGSMDIWKATDRRIIVYPCGQNKILNFVCIHPDHLGTLGSASGWNQEAAKESLLETFKEFDATILALLEKADPQSLKIWPLLDMHTLPAWVKDKFALLGDAAHPFLPYRGSGGAMAIEDAVSLAVMLSADVDLVDVPDRLQLYERARYQRVNKVLDYTRLCGRELYLPVTKEMEITDYIYGHDEFDHSTQLLRDHLWSKSSQTYWRQPTAFGPMPGPRRDFAGNSHASTLSESTFITASIKFKTSRTLLQNLLPNASYRFAKTDTVAYATFSQTTLDKMRWLGGGGYNHLGLYIHGVQYVKANGEIVQGTYLPILFENLADPILSGREELGMPKLYSSIDVDRRESSYHISCSWRGAVWGHFSLHDLEEQGDDGQENEGHGSQNHGSEYEGILTHRYIPSVGHDQNGKPDADYAVFVPKAEEQAVVAPKVTRTRKSPKASIKVDGLDWDALPTLHHITGRLAEIPIYDIVEAKVVEGQGVSDASPARRIE